MEKLFFKVILLMFCKANFFRKIPFRSIPFRSVSSFGNGFSTELGMPQNEHFLPRNNGNRSDSVPWNFFGTKFCSICSI
jgi:hypothetical protein